MELNNLKSPCDGCESNRINKTECKNMKICDKYSEWFAEVWGEIRYESLGIIPNSEEELKVMKKCATCKHGVFVEIWGEYKCRRFEKHCYNNDLYYLECKEYVEKGKKEEEDD